MIDVFDEELRVRAQQRAYKLVLTINASKCGILITETDARCMAQMLGGMNYEFAFGRSVIDPSAPQSEQLHYIESLSYVETLEESKWCLVEQKMYFDGVDRVVYPPNDDSTIPVSDDVMNRDSVSWHLKSRNEYVRKLIAVSFVSVEDREPINDVAAHSGSYRKALEMVDFINTSVYGITLITWDDARLLFGELKNTDMRFTPCGLCSYVEDEFFFDPYICKTDFAMSNIIDIGETPGTECCVIVQRMSEEDQTFIFPTDEHLQLVEWADSAMDPNGSWERVTEGICERRLYAIYSITRPNKKDVDKI